jgi:hypothetical protein
MLIVLFKIKRELEYIKEKHFKLEKEIQDLTEHNLKSTTNKTLSERKPLATILALS